MHQFQQLIQLLVELWDTELKTMDDLHKPALDGIGYQDSINSERAWWAGYYSEGPLKAETADIVTGKQNLRKLCHQRQRGIYGDE